MVLVVEYSPSTAGTQFNSLILGKFTKVFYRDHVHFDFMP